MNWPLYVISILLLGLCFCLFMLYRNVWVFRQRMKILNIQPTKEALRKDAELLNYDQMMLRWWIWDINRLKK